MTGFVLQGHIWFLVLVCKIVIHKHLVFTNTENIVITYVTPLIHAYISSIIKFTMNIPHGTGRVTAVNLLLISKGLACLKHVYSFISMQLACCLYDSVSGAALYSRRYDGSAQFVLLSTFYIFLLSLFTRITSALFIYDKRTLLDIGHRCTNLLQHTLSTDPAWPLEILRNTEVNKGRLNNPRRRKKHHGRRAGIRNRLRERAHSPPLLSILLANVQSLENKMDDLRVELGGMTKN